MKTRAEKDAWEAEFDGDDSNDDEIQEAMDDATSNAEGHNSPRYLRAELAARGLKICKS